MSVGGNEEATRLSGVNVDRTKILVYAISGVMVGLAALMFTARTSTGDPASGIGYELDAIAAAVVGGTSLSGGRGSIVGTLIGALFIGVLNNSLQLNSIDRYTALPHLKGRLFYWPLASNAEEEIGTNSPTPCYLLINPYPYPSRGERYIYDHA